MRRFVFGVVDLIVMVAILTAGVAAAPQATPSADIGPYQGTFYGRAYAGQDSRASMLLTLVHRGDQVEGTVYLGEGLTVDGGFCGTFDVPSTVQWVEGTTLAGDPDRLAVSPSFEVNGLAISVELESELSADGTALEAEAKIDLPWICGRDPVLTASLQRYWVGSP